MPFSTWLSLTAACLVVSLTPGAGAVNTMTTSLLVGWRRSIWTILGQQLALLLQIAITAAGLGAIVASNPQLFTAIRYIGAGYLVFLGLRMMLSRASDAPSTAQEEAAGGAAHAFGSSPAAMVRRGFWVNMSNPKAIVFLLAFMPLFISPHAPQLPQYLIFAVTLVVGDVLVMWGGFALLARSFKKLAANPRGQKALNVTFGLLFVAVAALLLLPS